MLEDFVRGLKGEMGAAGTPVGSQKMIYLTLTKAFGQLVLSCRAAGCPNVECHQI